MLKDFGDASTVANLHGRIHLERLLTKRIRMSTFAAISTLGGDGLRYSAIMTCETAGLHGSTIPSPKLTIRRSPDVTTHPRNEARKSTARSPLFGLGNPHPMRHRVQA
jgi:hypothetical protein